MSVPAPRRIRTGRVALAGAAAGAAVVLVRRRRPASAGTTVIEDPLPGGPPGRVIAVVNPGSGSAGAVDLSGVEVREAREGGDLREDLLRAVEDGAEVLGVAGGDGTVRCAARVAAAHRVPLWVVPGGTLNHFAVALGLESVEHAEDALRAGWSARVDLARAGDEVFVNTASLGVYGEIVTRRERLERFLPKTLALWAAVAATVARARPLEVTVDGRPERVWLVFIGNNPYEGLGIAGRPSLQRGLLDVRMLRARGPFPRGAVLLRLVAGRLRGSPWLRQHLAREVHLRGGRDTPLALDGEVLDHDGDIVFRSEPGALRVVVPPPGGDGGAP